LPTFTVFCASWGDYVTADKALQREGLIVEGKEGQRVRSPWYLVKIRAADMLLRFGDRFGLSPVARVGLAHGGRDGLAPAALGGDSLAEYLAQKPDSLDAYIAASPDRLPD
jgi:P27 family predicted phage terminase small subunit